jgi:hypothetical protein
MEQVRKTLTAKGIGSNETDLLDARDYNRLIVPELDRMIQYKDVLGSFLNDATRD